MMQKTFTPYWSIPGFSGIAAMLLLATLLHPAAAAAQQPDSCCQIAREKGQEAFNQQDYAAAISHWRNGKKCADATKCSDLDALIKKAEKALAAAEKPMPEQEMSDGIPMFVEPSKDDPFMVEDSPPSEQSQPEQAAPSVSTPSKEKNRSAVLKKLKTDMVRVAGGSFTMGCQSAQRDGECHDWEKLPRTVRVRGFSIGRNEVTQAQWRAVMGSDPPRLQFKGCDSCPVENVSWNDIKDFLTNLNTLTGKRFRLPTEAEWEYAARGGNQSRGFLYSGSSTIDEVAWYSSNSGDKTRPVGGKKPNELGLYDMSGNVWEWCEDDWHDNYNGAPTDGGAWVDSPRGGLRVLRGGSWCNDFRNCRAANRFGFFPIFQYFNYGFRLARD